MQIVHRMFIGLAFTGSLLCATACRDETVQKSEEAAKAAGEDIEAGAAKAVEKAREAGHEIREEAGPALERAGDKLKEKGAELRREVTTDDTTPPAADAGVPRSPR